MPVLSLPIPAAGLAARYHPYRSISDVFQEDQDRCLLPEGPVLPLDAAVSGWHRLLSMTYAVEDWFWDAVIGAWREWPQAFIAETGRALGCEGYAYLASIASPF